MKRLLLFLLLILLAPSVRASGVGVTAAAAGEAVPSVAIGGNGVWYRGDLSLPDDFEFGANGALSASPHISAVGAVYYGVEHSYLRGSVGVRVTATDVNDPNFAIGIGFQRHMSGEPNIRPEEWSPDVSIGWRPSPLNMPRVILAFQAGYGLDSEQTWLTAGIRYALNVGGER